MIDPFDIVGRVLFVTSSWSSAAGGIQTVNRELCCALASLAPCLEVVCISPSGTDRDVQLARSSGVSLLIPPHAPDPVDGPVHANHLPLDALRELPPRPMLAVIGHSKFTGDAAMAIRELLFSKARYVHFIHTSPLDLEGHKEYKKEFVEDRERRLSVELRLARGSDLTVCIGPRLTRQIRDRLAGEEAQEKLHQLDCGFPEQSEDAPGSEQLTCLCVGRTDSIEVKGLDIFAAAAGLFTRAWNHDPRNRNQPPPRFWVRGARGDGEALEKGLKVIAEKYAPSVPLLVRPFTTDPGALRNDYLQANLFMMPSREEGFGMAGCDAINFAVPSLVSANSGLGEAINAAASETDLDVHDFVVNMSGSSIDDIADRYASRARDLLCDRSHEIRARRRTAKLREHLRHRYTWLGGAKRLLELIAPAPRLGSHPASNALAEAPSHTARVRPLPSRDAAYDVFAEMISKAQTTICDTTWSRDLDLTERAREARCRYRNAIDEALAAKPGLYYRELISRAWAGAKLGPCERRRQIVVDAPEAFPLCEFAVVDAKHLILIHGRGEKPWFLEIHSSAIAALFHEYFAEIWTLADNQALAGRQSGSPPRARSQKRTWAVRRDGVIQGDIEILDVFGSVVPLGVFDEPECSVIPGPVELDRAIRIPADERAKSFTSSLPEGRVSRCNWSFRMSNALCLTQAERDLRISRDELYPHLRPGWDVRPHTVRIECDTLELLLNFSDAVTAGSSGGIEVAEALVDYPELKFGRAQWVRDSSESTRCEFTFSNREARLWVERPLVGRRYGISFKPAHPGEPHTYDEKSCSQKVLHSCRSDPRSALRDELRDAVKRALIAFFEFDHQACGTLLGRGASWNCSLWEFERRLLLTCFGEFRPEAWGSCFRYGSGIAGHCFRFGRAVAWINDPARPSPFHQVFVEGEAIPVSRHDWILCVPLRARNEGPPIGVLGFGGRSSDDCTPVCDSLRDLTKRLFEEDATVQPYLERIEAALSRAFWTILADESHRSIDARGMVTPPTKVFAQEVLRTLFEGPGRGPTSP